jgi:aspartate-semialdehyde dehydrogenase
MSASNTAPRIAVVGVSSLIGDALLDELRARKFPCASLHALDDARDLGRAAPEDGDKPPVGDVAAFDFSSIDLAFFCGRSTLAERYAEPAARHAWVIDSSSAFRARSDVPLVVADVNAGLLAPATLAGLIALPGSASVALATVLAPLHRLGGLARVEVATYQAVSGSGRAAMEGLASETVALLGGRKASGRSFGRQIAFNVVPQIDVLEPDGSSREEQRLLHETRRVLGLPGLAINATAVRVPVFFGHSLAIHVSFERDVTVAAASEMLRSSKGIRVVDPTSPAQFPTPAVEALAPDHVYIGRVRADMTRDRSLNFWVVADNVRKCAAHNAVSVAQILVNASQ